MKINITLISDTHGSHNEITQDLIGGDLLLHSGDAMTSGYNESELIKFCEWFDSIENYKIKIFIAGNHCRLFENFPERAKEIVSKYKSIIYLEDSEFIYNGIKIYGSPWQPYFYNWAFNLPRHGPELLEKWNAIPEDTNILLTHSPAWGLLDTVEFNIHHHLGCELLRERVDIIKPQIHSWGHIHSGRGYKFNGYTNCFNSSVLGEDYMYNYKPFNFEWDSETNDIIFK